MHKLNTIFAANTHDDNHETWTTKRILTECAVTLFFQRESKGEMSILFVYEHDLIVFN